MTGSPLKDQITQKELQALSDRQVNVHMQACDLVHDLDDLRRRIGSGAEIEDGMYFFDPVVHAVRMFAPRRRKGA